MSDEYDRLRRRVLWSMPYGLYVLGSRDGDRHNLMTVNLVSQVATEPKLVGAAVLKTSYTHELVQAGGSFTLNVLAREDKAMVRKFVKPVEVEDNGSLLNGFETIRAQTGAPVLKQAAAYLDCRVTQPVDTGDHTFFIGEVMDAAFMKPEDTEILRMEDTRMNYGG